MDANEMTTRKRKEFNAEYYRKNREKILARQNKYNEEHREQLALYRKKRKAMIMECCWCKKTFDKTGDILVFRRKRFCNEKCLGEYLVDKYDDEITTEWFETPENFAMRMQEDKYDREEHRWANN